jgi:hypothetical protein
MIPVASQDDSKGNHPNRSDNPNKHHKLRKQNPPTGEARTSHNCNSSQFDSRHLLHNPMMIDNP